MYEVYGHEHNQTIEIHWPSDAKYISRLPNRYFRYITYCVVFTWDDENREHLMKHGVRPAEAQFIVQNAASPFPQDVGGGKRRVWGASSAGRWLQVIYVLKKQDDVAFESLDPLDWDLLQGHPNVKIARVIHAMDMTPGMKRQLRRSRK